MSPEIVQKRDYYGDKSDVWACGILFYVMVFGHFPFKSSFEKDLFRKIIKGQFTYPEGTSEELKLMLNGILQVDPAKRLSAEEICQNVWLQQMAKKHQEKTAALDKLYASK
jgi:5'-AMP-activated protein kinase catalytic alpha subunit